MEALLSLGVSYVNELDSPKALRTLKAWVDHHPAYHGLEFDQNDGYSDSDSLMDRVMQLMLKAAEFAAATAQDEEEVEGAAINGGGVSEAAEARADVQVVLGVLYNVSRDFEAAAEAFEEAAKHRPRDHSAWNKLGATRANSEGSHLALPAYHR